MSNTLIDEIFAAELKHKSKIFKDKSKLSPEFIPDDLPGREKHMREIAQIIAPIFRGEQPKHIFIYGLPGTGKTCVMKTIHRKIYKQTKINETCPSIYTFYISCRENKTPVQVILKILNNPKIPSRGLNEQYYFNKLKEYIKTPAVIDDPIHPEGKIYHHRRYLIILDEIDKLSKLNEFFNILSRDKIFLEYLTIIGISNRYDLKKQLDEATLSSAYIREFSFNPYNALELNDILFQRVGMALYKNIIDVAEIRLIGAKIGKKDGDARKALRFLEASGEMSETRGHTQITEKDVEAAEDILFTEIINNNIQNLSDDEQLTLYAIVTLSLDKESDQTLCITVNRVHHTYRKLIIKSGAFDPKTYPTFRRFLDNLELSGLIVLQSSGKGQRGRATYIKLLPGPEYVLDTLTPLLEKMGFKVQ